MDRRLLLDLGGRRSGIDRRRYSYTVHIPERRYSHDRRHNPERRGKQTKYTALSKTDAGRDIAAY